MVTLLFTDLVASTEMLTRLGDDAAEEVRRTHFALLRQAIATTGGEEVKSLGDGLMVAFDSGVDALRCAVDMQRRIEEHNAAWAGPRLAVRVGLHAGEPLREGDDFHGEAVVVASRLCNEAEGGQILTSELVAGLVGSRDAFRFRPAGRLRLKGLPEPLAAVTVDWRPVEVPARRPATAARPGSLPPPRGLRLVGRDRELAVLESELERAIAGEFRCALLAGEGGVGKTRLAGELVSRHGDGVVSLSARAYPLGVTTAFGVWTEALEGHLRGLDSSEVDQLCAGASDDLAGLLRSVRSTRGTRSTPGEEPPRSRLLEAFTVVLSNLARGYHGPDRQRVRCAAPFPRHASIRDRYAPLHGDDLQACVVAACRGGHNGGSRRGTAGRGEGGRDGRRRARRALPVGHGHDPAG